MPITYADKVQNAVNPLPVTEQFRAVDANEIKAVVNTNETTLSTVSSVASGAASAAATAQSDIDTHEANTSNPHSVTKSQVGLGNVPNLSFSGSNTGDQDLSGLQPLDSDLTAIAALTPTNDDFIQRKAGAWTNRTIAQVKSDLGYPASWVNWSSSMSEVGWSSTTTKSAYYADNGNTVVFWCNIIGTSNSTSVTIQLPIAPNAAYGTEGIVEMMWCLNGGASAVGIVVGSGSSTTITCFSSFQAAGWVNSGSKILRFVLTYMK